LKNIIIHGKAENELSQFPDNSIGALVTDPPAGINFMNKNWDSDKGSPWKWIYWLSGIMSECLRVLKPGAYGLVWALPRISHRTALACELAGFHIKDIIYHLFGCLSEDTEILTINGWEHYHKNIDKSLVLCYDINNNDFLFDKPVRSFNYKNEYPAYSIKSDFTDQIVSRNHRVVVERNGKQIFQWAETCKQQENIPFLESLQDLPETIYDIQSHTSIKKSDLLKAVFKTENTKRTIWNSDGEKGKTDNDKMSCMWEEKRNKRKTKKIFFKKLLFPFMQSERKCKTPFAFLWQWQREKKSKEGNEIRQKSGMERWSNIFQKTWELCAYKICKMSTAIFSYGKKRWICDGTQIDNGTNAKSMSKENRSSTSCRSQSTEQLTNKSKIIQQQQTTQNIRRTRAEIKEITYTGNIWCVQVSTGAFVARRNGKIFITGNSGFPKNLSISKAIDREAGAEREVVGKKVCTDIRGGNYITDKSKKMEYNLTMPSTDAAKQWEGWGTALKPCIENWILIQKPKSEKTIAENVLKWNTGGINIDGCRVPMEQADFDAYKNKIVSFSSCTNKKFPGFMTSPLKHNISKKGRWPAQLIHDGSQAVMNEFEKYGEKTKRKLMNHEGSVGSIARFFYCAKESPQNKKSRIEGAEIDHPTVKSEKLMKYLITLITPPGETILDPFAGSGSTGYAGNKLGFSCILIEQDKHNFDLIINSLKTLEKYKEPELFNAEEIQNLTYKEKENFNDKPR